MNIATIEVSGTYAMIGRYVTIPAGIVGATVDFRFTDDLWAGLQKTVVFRSSVTRDVLLTGTVAVIPHETVAKPGDTLYVGVYGVDTDNNLAIPTLWTGIGGIRDAADPSGDPGTDPTIPIWAQLQQDVEQLKQNGGIPGPPGEPGPEGEDGEDGGYYTPDVTQLDEDTIQFTFTPSKPDMPAANSVTVELPSGQGSGGNAEDGFSPIAKVEQTSTGAVVSITDKTGTTTATITNGKDGAPGKDGADGQPGKDGNDYVLTPDDKTEIAEMAAGLVDVPESSGNGIHVGPDAPTDENVTVWIDTDEEAEAPSGGGINVTAEVGQTIVVKAVDENGTPTEWEAVDFPEVATPDWNAAEGEPGHVRNRTHYVETVELLNETINLEETETFSTVVPFIGGNTYHVTYNGVNYTCIALDLGDAVAIGNVSAMIGGVDTGEPFIMVTATEDGETFTICMDLHGETEISVKIVGEQITPIPIKFLNNALPYYINVYADSFTQPTSYTCMDTVSNVEAVLKSGRQIAVKYSTQEAISAMYQILNLVLVRPTEDGSGKVLAFMANGNLVGSKTGTNWIYLHPQEDGTYLVDEDLSND